MKKFSTIFRREGIRFTGDLSVERIIDSMGEMSKTFTEQEEFIKNSVKTALEIIPSEELQSIGLLGNVKDKILKGISFETPLTCECGGCEGAEISLKSIITVTEEPEYIYYVFSIESDHKILTAKAKIHFSTLEEMIKQSPEHIEIGVLDTLLSATAERVAPAFRALGVIIEYKKSTGMADKVIL